MILCMHPVIHSAKNRSLKYRNLTRTSPHPPSHCPPPSKQKAVCNFPGALPQTDATLNFLLLTQVHSALQIQSNCPTLFHGQPLSLSSANPRFCPAPLDSAQTKQIGWVFVIHCCCRVKVWVACRLWIAAHKIRSSC